MLETRYTITESKVKAINTQHCESCMCVFISSLGYDTQKYQVSLSKFEMFLRRHGNMQDRDYKLEDYI